MCAWILVKPISYGSSFSCRRSRNTKDSLELCVELCSRSGIWQKISWYVPPLLSLSDAQVFGMHTWVFMKPMFYGLAFSLRKIEKHKRFPWIMRWSMLPEWHLMENSMVNSSATQFIWCLCFPYVYVSTCEAHVLRLSIFLEEDRETQKIPLSYMLNYAPGAASDAKF